MDRLDFENILKVRKYFTEKFETPRLNSKDKRILKGEDKREYCFDYQLGTIGKFYIQIAVNNAKQKWQLRASEILVRIDINSRHMYPDGRISLNHIHIYYPDGEQVFELSDFDSGLFKSLKINDVLLDFFTFCNIDNKVNVILKEGI